MKKIFCIGCLTLLLSLVYSVNNVEARSYLFDDVKKESSHYEAINELSTRGFIGGFRIGPNVLEFKPNELIKRSEAAAMLTSVLNLPVMEKYQEVVSAYKDLDPNHPLILSITSAINEGIFKGEDGYFKEGVMNREQMASIIVRAFDLKEDEQKQSNINLSNVSKGHQDAVRIFMNVGITTETKDFRPKEKVTRAQFVSFLYRTMKETGLKKYNANKNKLNENFGVIEYSFTGIFHDSQYLYANSASTFHNSMKVSKDEYMKGVALASAYPNSYILLNRENEYIHLPQTKEIVSKKRTNIPLYSRALLTFSMEKASEVPIPEGKTIEQITAEQKVVHEYLKEKNGLEHDTHFNIFSKPLEGTIRWRAENIGPSKNQRTPMDPYYLVELMNQVIKTGEVYDGEYFSMHYNYGEGTMYITMREIFFD